MSHDGFIKVGMTCHCVAVRYVTELRSHRTQATPLQNKHVPT